MWLYCGGLLRVPCLFAVNHGDKAVTGGDLVVLLLRGRDFVVVTNAIDIGFLRGGVALERGFVRLWHVWCCTGFK